MKTTKTTAAITILIAAALALAACAPTETPTEPTTSPTSSPTATSSPTPSPTPQTVAPTQEPITRPTSQQEAITSASKVVESFQAASFQLWQNPELGEDYLDSFIVPGSRQETLIHDTVTYNLENGWRQSGSPSTWQTNDAMSYASQSTNGATGESYEFGTVMLYGCSDNRGWTMDVPAGQTPPDIPRGSFPRQWTLVYEQSLNVWLILDSASLTGQEGAPTC